MGGRVVRTSGLVANEVGHIANYLFDVYRNSYYNTTTLWFCIYAMQLAIDYSLGQCLF